MCTDWKYTLNVESGGLPVRWKGRGELRMFASMNSGKQEILLREKSKVIIHIKSGIPFKHSNEYVK